MGSVHRGFGDMVTDLLTVNEMLISLFDEMCMSRRAGIIRGNDHDRVFSFIYHMFQRIRFLACNKKKSCLSK